MSKYDCTMLNDKLVSMDHGPVNSMTLNCINGTMESESWSEFISDRDKYEVGLANFEITSDHFDELSRAEFSVLEETWASFGHMKPFEIRDYTHNECPEWEDPDGSSAPIPYERVFKFLMKGNAGQLAADINIERAIDEAFSITTK